MRPKQQCTLAGVVLAGMVLAQILPSHAQAAGETPYHAQVQYERGAHALRTGDITGSLVFFEKAVAESPGFLEALSLYGRALLAAGQDEKAAEILEQLANLSPGGNIDFYLGVAAYRMQEWEDAVRYLSAASKERSQSGQLQLYLGIAHDELGNDEAAKAALALASQLDPSLQGPIEYRLGIMAVEVSPEAARAHFGRVQEVAPSSNLARSANEYVDRIDSGYFRSWGFTAALGGGYDSNVSLATGEIQGQLGIDSGVGTGQLAGRATLLDRDEVVIDGGLGAYIQYHGAKPASLFDQIITQTWLRATTPLTSELEVNATYSFQYVWANYSPFRATHSGDVRFRYSPKGKSMATHAYYRIEGRDYEVNFIDPVRAANLNRDGIVQRAGVDQYMYTPDWWGWGRSYVLAGLRYRREHSNGPEYDSHGLHPHAEIGVPLPLKILWRTSFGFEWRYFDNPSCFQAGTTCANPSPGDPDREDHIAELFTSLRIPVNSQLDAELSYRFWNRNSNVSIYTYDRNLLELLVTYRY